MDAASEDSLRRAFVWACDLDVAAFKPGNVSRRSGGHGMHAAQFIASAIACGAPLTHAGTRVGERIESAVQATLAAVQCNTNLGIVLLCAPLAAACERWRAADGLPGLREALAGVLRTLDIDDARAAFRAITAARPAGLGAVEREDVSQAPTVDLRAAMALAADRDRIAFQYVHDHADVFDLGLPIFAAARRAALWRGLAQQDAAALAMQHTYLAFLAALPDSHIVRKHGHGVAHSVMAEAATWRAVARDGGPLPDATLTDWDRSLKGRGFNPGTSADLCVATAFVARLCDGPAP
jgi:triphosphoribosyl-dephospho-CoA synthase